MNAFAAYQREVAALTQQMNPRALPDEYSWRANVAHCALLAVGEHAPAAAFRRAYRRLLHGPASTRP